MSPFFPKKRAYFFCGDYKDFFVNSSMYHLFNKKLYNGLLVFLNSSKTFGFENIDKMR